MHHHDVKEEAQQVNFDDFSLGTAVQVSTPSDIHAGGQAIQNGGSSEYSSNPYLKGQGGGV